MTKLYDIDPAAGSRDGWSYSTYRRVGSAEIALRTPRALGSATVVADLFGVYGVRSASFLPSRTEIYVQADGHRLADGSTLGKSLIQSSMDSGAYLWSPVDWFSAITINDGEWTRRDPTWTPEAVPPDEVWIILMGPADDRNRRRFTAFWHDPKTPGEGGPPNHVRGQSYHAEIGEFTRGAQRNHVRVLIKGSSHVDH